MKQWKYIIPRNRVTVAVEWLVAKASYLPILISLFFLLLSGGTRKLDIEILLFEALSFATVIVKTFNVSCSGGNLSQ